jgi:hypothetical protein
MRVKVEDNIFKAEDAEGALLMVEGGFKGFVRDLGQRLQVFFDICVLFMNKDLLF